MYGHTLKYKDQCFDEAKTLPANTTSACANTLRVGSHLGGLSLTLLAANTAVALASTKKITVSYTECDTETGTFIAGAQSFAVAFSGGLANIVKGKKILTIVLPTTKKFVKVTIGTDDAAAAGQVDVILEPTR